ncbi:unnamed protein product [Medioppia subpectinata]|uniref:Uncharacterized protein n=1 Tax=Medioppia subpectinata TaxID=1979941 RepID=A0A7R9PUV1_9ACAR|nr:unnamed protein product [Medioppia subpectinata]CAG2101980.1 unnamed protein product [Medioppia subpectinata]
MNPEEDNDDSVSLSDVYANPDGYIIIKKSPIGSTVLKDLLGKRKRNVGGVVLKDLLGKKKRVSVVGGTVLSVQILHNR